MRWLGAVMIVLGLAAPAQAGPRGEGWFGVETSFVVDEGPTTGFGFGGRLVSGWASGLDLFAGVEAAAATIDAEDGDRYRRDGSMDRARATVGVGSSGREPGTSFHVRVGVGAELVHLTTTEISMDDAGDTIRTEHAETIVSPAIDVDVALGSLGDAGFFGVALAVGVAAHDGDDIDDALLTIQLKVVYRSR